MTMSLLLPPMTPSYPAPVTPCHTQLLAETLMVCKLFQIIKARGEEKREDRTDSGYYWLLIGDYVFN